MGLMQHQTMQRTRRSAGKTDRDAAAGNVAYIDDGFQFAEAGRAWQGVWPVAGFARLRDVLSTTGGALECEVRGDRDDFGRPALRVRISGSLQLICQRCLGALDWPLRIDSLLVLARSEAEIEAQSEDPEGPDSIVGGKEMAVGTLLEDEILLAVPYAPHHDVCGGAAENQSGGAKDSPFADLRGLLNRGGRARN